MFTGFGEFHMDGFSGEGGGQKAHWGDCKKGKSGEEVQVASVPHSGEECGCESSDGLWLEGTGFWKRMLLKIRVRACADGNGLGGRRVKVQERDGLTLPQMR